MYSVKNTDRSVGYPIRILADQRLLSSPRNFSQSATSFFASHCQGIHQMPFFFLDSLYAYVQSYNRTYPIYALSDIYVKFLS